MSRSSTLPPLQTSTQSSALQTRISAKRAELENLKQLRDLSATLASRMSALEQKLATLRDGTEAVSHVLANWDNVLNVIGMAGAKAATLIPSNEVPNGESKNGLPETLVRIPVQDRDGEKERGAGE